MGAHLHQHRAGGQLLVVPGGAHGHGPGQGGIEVVHALLEPAGQGQVLHPAGVLAPLAGAQHQHDLGGVHPVDAGDRLVDGAVLPHQGVPVDVQHDFDGRVLRQVVLHRLGGAVVGPAVPGVVVEGGVVHHAQAQLGEHPLHLVPHPHHVVVLVQGAGVVVRGLVDVGAVGGVGLAAVGVDDQDLGPVAGQGDVHRRGGRRRQIHVQPGAVIEVDAPRRHIALGAGGHQGAGHDVPRGGGGLRRRLVHVVVILGGLPGGEVGGVRRLRPVLRRGLPARQQQRRLPHHQAAPAVQARQGAGLPGGLSQLQGQGGGDEARVLPQAPQGPGGGAPARHQQQGPHRQGGKEQGGAPPQQAAPSDLRLHTASSSFVVGW